MFEYSFVVEMNAMQTIFPVDPFKNQTSDERTIGTGPIGAICMFARVRFV